MICRVIRDSLPVSSGREFAMIEVKMGLCRFMRNDTRGCHCWGRSVVAIAKNVKDGKFLNRVQEARKYLLLRGVDK